MSNPLFRHSDRRSPSRTVLAGSMSRRHRSFAARWCSAAALCTLWFLAAGLAGPLAAADFPPVPDQHRQLTEVQGAPGAEAVVLDEEAELWMMDPSAQRMMSTLEVWRRVKVLSPEGAEDYGEIEIRHSRQLRLANFKGRTLLPDGREVEVGSDAVFERTASRAEKEFVTAVAFPNVEPGAILDYSYDLHFDSIFHLEPWYFQTQVPVLRSEIVYHIPNSLVVGAWGKGLPGKDIQQEVQTEKDARRLHVWMENLPALPDEPSSVPDEDLSAKFMLIPKRFDYLGSIQPLLEEWVDVCRLVEDQIYEDVGRKAKAVKRKAKELTAGAGATSRERARVLYDFVRDEIDTLVSWSVFPRNKVGLDDVLEEGRGTNSEKALLLQSLLRAEDLEAELVWAPNRWDGAIDTTVPNPYWFEKVLVRAHLPFDGGEEVVLLDPSDRDLGFGFLNPFNEGVPALIYDKKKPETLNIPLTPARFNRREGTFDLALDADGRLSGEGTLQMHGHHAWVHLGKGRGEKELPEAWEEWLAGRWEGFDVSAVEVEEDRASRRLEVRFQLAQQEGQVLGDEASVQLSRPLGPVDQPFELSPERRRTPVLMFFGDLESLEASVSWPEGWEVEVAPESVRVANAVGRAVTEVAVDDEARELTYKREMEVKGREFNDSESYGALRQLFETMERSDAEPLVLIAE